MLQSLAVLLLHCVFLSLGQEVKQPLNLTLPGIPKLNNIVSYAKPTNSVASLPSLPALPRLPPLPTPPPIVPCTCGVFLTGQFVKGSHLQPTGYPALLHEYETPFPCTPAGQKQCANKCLEVIARHLPHSGTIICGTIDRDCYKERAYLWTKNCNDVWVNSNMSAGREFCCKDGLPYKCPPGRQ